MAGIKPPKPLVVNSEIDMAHEWIEWLELYKNYFIANKLLQETPEIKNANFRAVTGREGLKGMNNSNLPEDVTNNLDALTAALTTHFAPSKNKTYEPCQFYRIKQHEGEAFEDFLQKLQTQVIKRGYGHYAEEFVMDQIVVRMYSDATRQKWWTEDDLDFEKSKKIYRAAERASKEINEIHFSGLDLNSTRVNVMTDTKTVGCNRCGFKHEKHNCSAYNKTCNKCGKGGHFGKMCKAKIEASNNEEHERESRRKEVNSDGGYMVK